MVSGTRVLLLAIDCAENRPNNRAYLLKHKPCRRNVMTFVQEIRVFNWRLSGVSVGLLKLEALH